MGDLKVMLGFPGTHELEGPEADRKDGVCSSPEKSPTFEVWENPNVCAEEEWPTPDVGKLDICENPELFPDTVLFCPKREG